MFREPLRRARNGLLTEQEWSEPPVTFRGYISKKNVYSRKIGPASGRRASGLFIPYVLNIRLCVLCVLNVLNVRAS